MGKDDERGFIPVDELIGPRDLAVTTDNAADDGGGCGCGPSGCGPSNGTAAGGQQLIMLAAPTARPQLPVDAQVKQRYDALAQQGTSTLCSSPRAVYSEEELRGVPSWVLELSSGCGSPLDAIDLRPGQTVVDFGCGAGLDLLLAAARVGPDGRVIGIDGSPHMVRTARRAVAEAGLSSVDVRVGDIRRPPVRAGSVDVVLSNCVLGMFPDKLEVLSAVAEVLRPGGYAVISDIVYADGSMPPAVTTEDAATADDFARCVVGMTATEYQDLVRQAGFERIEIRSDGLVPYRDGAEVTSAMIIAHRADGSGEVRCC